MAQPSERVAVAPPMANTAALPEGMAQPPVGIEGAQAIPGKTSLYVGDLAPNINEASLYEKFVTQGPLVSVRVCRDNVTKRSLGYAYVNFVNPGDAEKALNELNYEPLQDRPMRIMWTERDPTKRRTGKGNIFIRNLHEDIDNKVLHDTFAQFGTVLSCKILRDEHGNSRGMGFVHFEDPEDADKAIKNVHEKMISDKRVYVSHFKTKRQRQEEYERQAKNFTNVYVKNIAAEVTAEEFQKMFEKFGPITSCKLVFASDGTGHRGFGFVAYENSDSAHKAVDEMNNQDIHGKVLFAGRAQKKKEREALLRRQREAKRQEMRNKYQNGNLYVKNLDEDVDDKKLAETFGEYGTIVSAKVAIDKKTGQSRGFGYVCFENSEQANKAMNELHGKQIWSRPLYVSLHQTKEQRYNLFLQRQQNSMFRMQQQMMGFPPQMMMPMGMRYTPGRGQRPVMFPPRPQVPMMGNFGGVQPGNNPAAGMPHMARNGPRPGQAMLQQQQQPTRPSLETLRAFTTPQKAGAFGNELYSRLEQVLPANQKIRAGKVTGMILEQPVEEILALLDVRHGLARMYALTGMKDKTLLEERAREAIAVLESA